MKKKFDFEIECKDTALYEKLYEITKAIKKTKGVSKEFVSLTKERQNILKQILDAAKEK